MFPDEQEEGGFDEISQQQPGSRSASSRIRNYSNPFSRGRQYQQPRDFPRERLHQHQPRASSLSSPQRLNRQLFPGSSSSPYKNRSTSARRHQNPRTENAARGLSRVMVRNPYASSTSRQTRRRRSASSSTTTTTREESRRESAARSGSSGNSNILIINVDDSDDDKEEDEEESSDEEGEVNDRNENDDDDEKEEGIEVLAVESLDSVLRKRMREAEENGEMVDLSSDGDPPIPPPPAVKQKITVDDKGHEIVWLDDDDEEDNDKDTGDNNCGDVVIKMTATAIKCVVCDEPSNSEGICQTCSDEFSAVTTGLVGQEKQKDPQPVQQTEHGNKSGRCCKKCGGSTDHGQRCTKRSCSTNHHDENRWSAVTQEDDLLFALDDDDFGMSSDGGDDSQGSSLSQEFSQESAFQTNNEPFGSLQRRRIIPRASMRSLSPPPSPFPEERSRTYPAPSESGREVTKAIRNPYRRSSTQTKQQQQHPRRMSLHDPKVPTFAL